MVYLNDSYTREKRPLDELTGSAVHPMIVDDQDRVVGRVGGSVVRGLSPVECRQRGGVVSSTGGDCGVMECRDPFDSQKCCPDHAKHGFAGLEDKCRRLPRNMTLEEIIEEDARILQIQSRHAAMEQKTSRDLLGAAKMANTFSEADIRKAKDELDQAKSELDQAKSELEQAGAELAKKESQSEAFKIALVSLLGILILGVAVGVAVYVYKKKVNSKKNDHL